MNADMIDRLAQALRDGAYVLSDNDGTLAPFTQTPDQTIIPAQTLDAISRFGALVGPERFVIVTGRAREAMQAVIARSTDAPPEIPMISDDGALYSYRGAEHAIQSGAELEFMSVVSDRIASILGGMFNHGAGLSDLVIPEYKRTGININLNELHRVNGAEAAAMMKEELQAVFHEVCLSAPVIGDNPAFAVHFPPGHGVEIRSRVTTKQQGIEALMDKGVIPADSGFIYLCDDLKQGGNDVEIARFVKERGGFVVQVKHTGDFRAYPDEQRAIPPDMTVEGSPALAELLEQVLTRYEALAPAGELENGAKPARLGM